MKYILILTLFLVGCSQTVQPRIEYKEKIVVNYKVPSPPPVECLPLQTSFLTPEQKEDLGELAKAYSMDRVILAQCAQYYKDVYNKYNELSKQENPVIPPVLPPINNN